MWEKILKKQRLKINRSERDIDLSRLIHLHVYVFIYVCVFLTKSVSDIVSFLRELSELPNLDQFIQTSVPLHC